MEPACQVELLGEITCQVWESDAQFWPHRRDVPVSSVLFQHSLVYVLLPFSTQKSSSDSNASTFTQSKGDHSER